MTHRSPRGLICFSTGPIAGLAFVGLATAPAAADIDVSLRGESPAAAVGDTVRMQCFLSSEDAEEYCCATFAIDWDPTRLRLIGADQAGAENTQMAWWPVQTEAPIWTLNEEIPPQDGTGLYIVLAPLGADQIATPDGSLVTTFEFEALASGPAEVGLSFEGPGVEDKTIVWGAVLGMQATGQLFPGMVTIGSSATATCPSDVNGDAEVGIDDVLEVFNNWQAPYTVDDLVSVLMNFGPCSP